jgi:hypothetical protein
MKNIFILIAALTLTGCMGKSFLSYQGATISKSDSLVQLQQEGQKGLFATNELSVNYSYQMTPEGLRMAGTVKILGFSARRIKRLVVQLLFADAQGVVIQDTMLYSAPYRSSTNMAPLRFEKTFPIPEGSKSIAFTYDGELSDGGNTSINIGYFPP